MKKYNKTLILALIMLSTSVFAQGDNFTERVKVKYSKPVYQTIEEEIPNRNSSCYEEYEVRTPITRSSSYRNENNIGVDTIIGATTGVIIGNQIGRGNGRVAAKVIGGLLGATVANGMRNHERTQDNSQYYYETKRRNICNNKIVRRTVLTGYDNYFTYNGKSYSKFSKHQKDYITVETSINY
jgi:uncharacterized protein YcfJ